MAKYGYPDAAWEAASEEARSKLVEVAKKQRTIAYSELCPFIRSINFLPNDPAFHALLGGISCDEDAAGRGMLSVLVVHLSGDMKPGKGFFDLAGDLGREWDDDDELWVREFKAVLDAWSGVS